MKTVEEMRERYAEQLAQHNTEVEVGVSRVARLWIAGLEEKLEHAFREHTFSVTPPDFVELYANAVVSLATCSVTDSIICAAMERVIDYFRRRGYCAYDVRTKDRWSTYLGVKVSWALNAG